MTASNSSKCGLMCAPVRLKSTEYFLTGLHTEVSHGTPTSNRKSHTMTAGNSSKCGLMCAPVRLKSTEYFLTGLHAATTCDELSTYVPSTLNLKCILPSSCVLKFPNLIRFTTLISGLSEQRLDSISHQGDTHQHIQPTYRLSPPYCSI